MNLVSKLFKDGILNIKEQFPIDEIKENFLIIKEQTFLPYLFYVTNDMRFKKYYYSSVLLHENFQKVVDKINLLFNENKIYFFYFKGIELLSLYHDPNLRLSGDIDLCVDKKQYSFSKKILIENNFTLFEYSKHHTEFKYLGIIVELHHSLIESDETQAKYFAYPFKNTYGSDYHLHLNHEYHFLFILVHYLKHLKNGAGLRTLGDIYLMLTKLNIDKNYLIKEISKMNLDNYFNTILNELIYIFNYDVEELVKLGFKFNQRDDIEKLIAYSLKSGIHGYGKENDHEENKFKHQNKNKFSYLLKKIFIPLSLLFEKYPYSKSIILIPFAYIHHFINLLLFKKNKLSAVIKSKKTDDSLKSFIE